MDEREQEMMKYEDTVAKNVIEADKLHDEVAERRMRKPAHTR